MIRTTTEVRVHYFSETEVEEASQLAESRQQRLCAVSETGTTECYFLVPYHGHFAEAKISVSATRPQHAHHVAYEVLATYQSCCKDLEEPCIDEEIRRSIQLVYDTHIQAVRLKFDRDCCERRPCRQGESISCQERKQKSRECLKRLPLSDVETRDDCLTDNIEPEISEPALLILAQPQSSLPARGAKRKRVSHAHLGQRSTGDVPNQEQGKDLEQRSTNDAQNEEQRENASNPPRSCLELATGLITAAKKGLMQLKQKPEVQGKQDKLHALVVSYDNESVKSDEGLVALLKKLDAEFKKRECTEKDKANPKVWQNWYFSACIRMILHSRGKWRNDRRTKGVNLLHQIVNKIAVSQGPKALMVIQAYAERDVRLSRAARSNAHEQNIISDLVVAALHPILEHEEEKQALVPFPAAWISSATGMSYRGICKVLDIPNFCVFSTGHLPELNESLCYSTASKLWSDFVKVIPQLHMDIKVDPPPNWEQLPDMTKFEWLLVRHCDSIEARPHIPSGSRASPVHDDETSTCNTDEASGSHADRAHDDETPTGSTDENGTSPRFDTETGSGWDVLDWTQDFDLPFGFDFMRSIDSSP